MGGLARKATIIDELIEETPDLFIVDAGNLFFKKEIIEPGIPYEKAISNASIILKSFNQIGCDAFSPGGKDFAAGKEFLLNMYSNAEFPFISCNIYNLKNELLFKPYIIKETRSKDLKIAFIGASSIFESEGIIVKDPIESLNYIINEVASFSDIIVLLFSSNDNDIKLLQTQDYDALTMVIRSHSKKKSINGGPKTPVYSLGDRGKVLYKFDLIYNDISMPLVDVNWCEHEIKQTNINLDKMKQGNMVADLHVLYKNNPETLKRVKKYEQRIENANQALENKVNTLVAEKIELDKTIIDKIDILQIIDKYKYTSDIPHEHVPHDHDGDGYPDH